MGTFWGKGLLTNSVGGTLGFSPGTEKYQTLEPGVPGIISLPSYVIVETFWARRNIHPAEVIAENPTTVLLV